jgi:N-acetylglucosaminyl-diphospho-decaprenol L-rhamnosyltransferase
MRSRERMSPERGLDVAIVAYRSRGMLRECLASLRAHAPPRTHVVVVDNDSRDGTIEMVRSEFLEVELVPAGENLGFAAATNFAIRRGSAPYVLALNPDTRVHSGTLDRLIRLMEERSEVGICGCRLELEDGRFDHAAKRSFPTPVSALAHFSGIGKRASSGPLAAYRAPEVEEGPVDAVNGAFMLMRRAALDQVGLFDEGFWLYMEDLDLCYRFAEAGWVTWYEPTVAVTHIKAGTSGRRRRVKVNYAFHYGMYRFYKKHYAPKRSGAMNGAVYLGIAGKFAVSVVRNEVGRVVDRLREQAVSKRPAAR